MSPFRSFLTAFLFAVATLLPFSHATPAQAMKKANVITSCTKPNTVALTFDDGPYKYLEKIAQTLESVGAKGTFFFNGNNYGCIYDEENVKRIKRALSGGHQVASHTWSHQHLNKLSRGQIDSEITRMSDALRKVAGVVPTCMRPPYGDYNDEVLQVASSKGLTVVTWDFDSRDSLGESAEGSKRLYDKLIDRHPNTILTLNHEVYASTANDVVPYVVQKLKAAGYQLVTVAECLEIPAYQSKNSPSRRDGSWTCS